jgi:thiamine-monophosphate kinase
MDEFKIIKNLFCKLTKSSEAAQNLNDDVAKISLKKNEELVVSKDMFVEDLHFLCSDGAFKIASKLLLTNLSDLASAGANPIYYMLGFSKNKDLDKKFYTEFCRGLNFVQNKFDLCLIGGDTVFSQKLVFSVTIFGVVKKNRSLARFKACEGDLIFVSGNIGDAFLGLLCKQNSLKKLTKSEKNYFLDRHFYPTPRIELGKNLLKKKLANAAIDVSDGFFSDLRHICQASKLDAKVYLNKIPISDFAKKALKKNSQIENFDLFSGGDDYELIFSSNPKNLKKILTLSKDLNLRISCVGSFVNTYKKSPKIDLFSETNQKITIKKFGYEH